MSKQRTRVAHGDNGRLGQIAHDLESKATEIVGAVITYHPGGERPHGDVLAALKAANLDEKACRDILPRNAFSRAAGKLAEDGSVDHTRETADEVGFQFTRKAMGTDADGAAWEFTKECVIWLNKDTGKVWCQVPKSLQGDEDTTKHVTALETRARALVKHYMQTKSVSDITAIVRKQFEAQAQSNPTSLGLCPLPDSDRAYLVLKEEFGFLDKVKKFMSELGGRVSFLPIPGGTREGSKTVAETLALKFEGMAKEHEAVVNGFGINTRQKTIDEQAEFVKSSRAKLAAHAHLLAEHAKDLREAIDKGDELLRDRITKLVEERAHAPEGEGGGGHRAQIFGHPITAVLRWMGANGWSRSEARKVIDSYGCQKNSDTTIAIQIRAGRTGKHGDQELKPAELTKEQAKELEKARKEPAADAVPA